jgi:methoxymalonate biosynthesis acyl carrier protein
MPSLEEVTRRLARLFAERLNTEVPAADTDLFETGILDSLRFVELLATLEESFGVRVSVEELEIDDFRSLARIADFLIAKSAQPAPP